MFLRGRADDVINNGGAKFYPKEVENILMDHPCVVEAVVLGLPHEQFGEQAVTCVVANSPVAELKLQEFCTRRMEPYKIPKIIMSLPEMPRNPAGKIVKAKLKEIFRRHMENRSPTP